MLSTVGDENLARLDGQSGVSEGLFRDRLSQLRESRCWGVLVVRHIKTRLRSRFDDMGRSGKVRFSGTVANDRFTRGL